MFFTFINSLDNSNWLFPFVILIHRTFLFDGNQDEYTNSEPDAISEFGGKIAEHMNGDHMSATIGIVVSGEFIAE